MYYVITKGGEGGSENDFFWLHSVLKVITKGRGGVSENPKSWLRNKWMVPRYTSKQNQELNFPQIGNERRMKVVC